MSLFDKLRQLTNNSSASSTLSTPTENAVHLFYTVGSEIVIADSEISEGMSVGGLIDRYAEDLGMDPYSVNKIKQTNADGTYSFVTKESPVVKSSRYRFYVMSEEKGVSLQ